MWVNWPTLKLAFDPSLTFWGLGGFKIFVWMRFEGKFFFQRPFWPFRLAYHSELFGLFSFGNWKFENLPISILLSIILLFIPYIFIIQSKKNYRLCKTLKKIVLKSGENCFFATFSIFSLVSQGTNLVKTHTVATFCRKY